MGLIIYKNGKNTFFIFYRLCNLKIGKKKYPQLRNENGQGSINNFTNRDRDFEIVCLRVQYHIILQSPITQSYKQAITFLFYIEASLNEYKCMITLNLHEDHFNMYKHKFKPNKFRSKCDTPPTISSDSEWPSKSNNFD